jgi:hypothetical protein
MILHSRMKGEGGFEGGFVKWVVGLVIGFTIFSSMIGTALTGVAGLTNATLYGAAGVTIFGLTGLFVAIIFLMKIGKSGGLM